MAGDRFVVLPFVVGSVTFATDIVVSVEDEDGRIDLPREWIAGRQPRKGELVIVLNVQDLADALREGDDALVEVDGGTIVGSSKKAVSMKLADDRVVSLPKQFVDGEVDDYVRSVRVPRWLALDRGMKGVANGGNGTGD
jgi:hypothetical protein